MKLHPISTIGAPLFVLLLLTGLGVYGTLAGAQATANTNRDAAHSTADETATSFTLTVQQVRCGQCTMQGLAVRQAGPCSAPCSALCRAMQRAMQGHAVHHCKAMQCAIAGPCSAPLQGHAAPNRNR